MMRDKMKPGSLKSELIITIYGYMTNGKHSCLCNSQYDIYIIASSVSCIEIMSAVKCDI